MGTEKRGTNWLRSTGKRSTSPKKKFKKTQKKSDLCKRLNYKSIFQHFFIFPYFSYFFRLYSVSFCFRNFLRGTFMNSHFFDIFFFGILEKFYWPWNSSEHEEKITFKIFRNLILFILGKWWKFEICQNWIRSKRTKSEKHFMHPKMLILIKFFVKNGNFGQK